MTNTQKLTRTCLEDPGKIQGQGGKNRDLGKRTDGGPPVSRRRAFPEPKLGIRGEPPAIREDDGSVLKRRQHCPASRMWRRQPRDDAGTPRQERDRGRPQPSQLRPRQALLRITEGSSLHRRRF